MTSSWSRITAAFPTRTLLLSLRNKINHIKQLLSSVHAKLLINVVPMRPNGTLCHTKARRRGIQTATTAQHTQNIKFASRKRICAGNSLASTYIETEWVGSTVQVKNRARLPRTYTKTRRIHRTTDPYPISIVHPQWAPQASPRRGRPLFANNRQGGLS